MKRGLSRYLTLIGLGCILFCADFLLKKWVHHHLPLLGCSSSYPYEGIPVFHNFLGIDFSINHLINTGAAWGVFASFSDYLLYFRILAIIFLCLYMYFSPKKERDFPLLFIVAGALGNVFDLFLYGHVVDMFYFVFWGYSYPVFNLADVYICFGVILLLWRSYTLKRYVPEK